MAWICSYGVVDCPECKRNGRRLKWAAEAVETTDRMYFRIPYAEKDEAKALGARWDADRRLWYGLGSNPKLSEIGKRWPVATPPKSKPRASAVPDLFDVTATVPEAPTAQPQPEPVPEPVPGSIPWEEFMDAIRAADASASASTQAADRLPVAREVAMEKKNAR